MAEQFDKKKLRQLARGQSEAVDDWFDTFCDKLYTFVFYRLDKDPLLAADVVRETFLRALRQITNFDRQRGTMFSWLTYLSKDCMKKALLSAGRAESSRHIWTGLAPSLVRDYQAIAAGILSEETLERAETTQLVQMTLGSIPERYSRVLTDYYYSMKTTAQVADSEAIDEVAVKALLYRARTAFAAAFAALAGSLGNPDRMKGQSDEPA